MGSFDRKFYMKKNLLVFKVEVFAVACDGAQLLAVAAHGVGGVGVLLAAAEPQPLHHRVDLGLEHLAQLKTNC